MANVTLSTDTWGWAERRSTSKEKIRSLHYFSIQMVVLYLIYSVVVNFVSFVNVVVPSSVESTIQSTCHLALWTGSDW